MARTTPGRRKRWLIVGAAAAVLVGAGGPYVYINYIQDDPPAALSLESPPAAPESTSGSGPPPGATCTRTCTRSTAAGAALSAHFSMLRAPRSPPSPIVVTR
ncbi:hypothetical protein [Streptomyces sp. DH10]|uniref:hypothetical protein n=1 Tax=Streptomyces sp. DH10 TaxID=3040121 RepID=UPI0024412258|nr:hypothetical protein [Streptomyces sp. DH10]MDG9708660.1 hypothetical protein [Streptomyces sp. DH10]